MYKKIATILVVIAIILFGAFKFLQGGFVVPIGEIKIIDKAVFGNANISNIIEITDKNNLFVKKEDNKKYNLFTNKFKKLFIFLNHNRKEDKYSLNNQSAFNGNMKLDYKISNDTNVQVVYRDNQLNFILPERKISIENKLIDTQKENILSLDNLGKNKVFKLGNSFYDLNNFQKTDTELGEIKHGAIKIFDLSDNTLLNRDVGSFVNGLWTTKVGDCSMLMGNQADIAMENFNNDGILKLSSKNHYACTNKTFPVRIDKDKIYKLSFDYKNITGNDVRYYYKLRSSKNNKVWYATAETIQAKDNQWHTFSTIINPKQLKENLLSPEIKEEELGSGFNIDKTAKELSKEEQLLQEIDLIDIYFYAPSDGSKEVINLYDNVKLSEYEFEKEEKLKFNINIGDDVVLNDNIALKDGENKFEYIVNDANLFDAKIASVEDGLWKKEVGDCSRSRSGKADINLQESSDASDGERAIELSSKNHYACINKTFSVALSNSKTYKLQFDYKNIKGGEAMYYYNLRNDDKNEAHSERIKVDDNEWHTFETIIDPKIDSIKNIDIFFYAPSDGSKEVVNLYDNVRLVEWLPKDIDSYYLYAEQEVDETPKLKTVEYKAVNRWKNKVVLHGVKNSFLLAYPEKYSERWKSYPMELKAKSNKIKNSFDNYKVPEIESNRQATKDEAKDFVKNSLVSVVGDKFISKNFDGSIRNDNLDNGWFGETFFKPTIPEETHYQINNYGNAWWIDIDKICKKDNKCIQNDDDTYEIELVIENKFNKYASVMLLICGTTFFSLISYLGYDWYRRRKNIL